MHTLRQKRTTNSHISRKVFHLLIPLLFLMTSSLWGQTEFIFNGDRDFELNSNWENGMAPGSKAGNIIITIAANATVSDSFTIAANSVLNINDNLTLTVSTDGNFITRGEVNVGTSNNRTGTLSITANSTYLSYGTITAEGPVINNGTFTNAGIFDANNTFTNKNSFTNDGTLTTSSTIGTSDETGDSFQNNGIINVNGKLDVFNGIFSQAEMGILQGSDTVDLNGAALNITAGTIGGALEFDNTTEGNVLLTLSGGTLAPGSSPGTITVTGDLTLTSGITFSCDILEPSSGTSGTAGTDNDEIVVSGAFTNDADILINLGDGEFEPGDDYSIVSYSSSMNEDFMNVTTNSDQATSTDFSFSSGASPITLTYNGETVLPITLLSFEGQAEGGVVRLDWRTAQELNNDYMAVERSRDGSQFRELGWIAGAGTTQQMQTYRFVDEAPAPGTNYYRLRQVDFDGAVNYSQVIAVDADSELRSPQLSVFPNPTHDKLRIQWASPMGSEEGGIQVYEAGSGRLLARYDLPEGQNFFDIPVQDLNAGEYIIQLLQAGQVAVKQFVKF